MEHAIQITSLNYLIPPGERRRRKRKKKRMRTRNGKVKVWGKRESQGKLALLLSKSTGGFCVDHIVVVTVCVREKEQLVVNFFFGGTNIMTNSF